VAERGIKGEIALLCYRVGKQEFAVPLSEVARILPLLPVANIPHTPEFLEGVVEYDGILIPVIDLRKRFGLGEGGAAEEARIVVVRINGEKVGMVVDEAKDMVQIKSSEVKKPPTIFPGLDAPYLTGVVKRGERYLVLLDLRRVLTTEERLELFGLEGLLSGEEPLRKKRRRKGEKGGRAKK